MLLIQEGQTKKSTLCESDQKEVKNAMGYLIIAKDGQTVTAKKGYTVFARKDSKVIAKAGSTVIAENGSTVIAYHGSTVFHSIEAVIVNVA